MNKKLLIVAALIFMTTAVFANELTPVDTFSSGKRVESLGFDGSKATGVIKAGVALGYPTGVIIGWRPSDLFELNALIGTKYTGFTIGLSPMFTLANLNISDQLFPLSLGPAVYLNMSAFGFVDLDVLAVVRLEYTFPKMPLNFFIEGGAGININFYSSAYSGLTGLLSPVRFSGSASIGARYVF